MRTEQLFINSQKVSNLNFMIIQFCQSKKIDFSQ